MADQKVSALDHRAGSWRRHLVQRRLVDAIAWVTWREVAVDDVAATADGPVLLVANHFGGAADAVVLMSVLPRRPRILADDTIWRYPVAKQVMEWLGAIPVHRGRSGGGSDNTDMFAAAHDALAMGEIVLIFPEGITREEPSIGEVRTGAARIAIGAYRAGVRGLRIVPAGIHYDDKAAFRSVVYVREGTPIDLDAEIEAHVGSDDERDDVRELTALIESRLRASAPDYDDWQEARALQMGAEAYLRSLEPGAPVPVNLRDRLAGWLARSPRRDDVVAAAADYRAALAHGGVTDEWAAHGSGWLTWRRVVTILTWVIALPWAAMGVVAFAVPILLTWLVSKVRLAPAVMATVLPLVALVFFGATSLGWMVWGYARSEFSGVMAAIVMLPTTFVALGLVMERGFLWLRWLRNRALTLGGRGRRLADRRSATVAAVAAAVDAELGDGATAAARPAVGGPSQ